MAGDLSGKWGELKADPKDGVATAEYTDVLFAVQGDNQVRRGHGDPLAGSPGDVWCPGGHGMPAYAGTSSECPRSGALLTSLRTRAMTDSCMLTFCIDHAHQPTPPSPSSQSAVSAKELVGKFVVVTCGSNAYHHKGADAGDAFVCAPFKIPGQEAPAPAPSPAPAPAPAPASAI